MEVRWSPEVQGRPSEQDQRNHQTTGLSSAWPSQCLIVSSLDTGVGAWRSLVKCLWQQMNEMRKEEEEEEEEEEGGQLKRDLK